MNEKYQIVKYVDETKNTAISPVEGIAESLQENLTAFESGMKEILEIAGSKEEINTLSTAGCTQVIDLSLVLEKEIKDGFADKKKELHQRHRSYCGCETLLLNEATAIRELASNRRLQIHREEAAEARRKQAEIERLRREEAERLERERKEKEKAERLERERLRKIEEEKNKHLDFLSQAAAMQEKKEAEEALRIAEEERKRAELEKQKLEATPVETAAPAVSSIVTEDSRQKVELEVEVEVLDSLQLIQAIAKGQLPHEIRSGSSFKPLLKPNLTAIRQALSNGNLLEWTPGYTSHLAGIKASVVEKLSTRRK